MCLSSHLPYSVIPPLPLNIILPPPLLLLILRIVCGVDIVGVAVFVSPGSDGGVNNSEGVSELWGGSAQRLVRVEDTLTIEVHCYFNLLKLLQKGLEFQEEDVQSRNRGVEL